MGCSRQGPVWRWNDTAVSEKPSFSWTGWFGLFFFLGTRGTSISVCVHSVNSNGILRVPMKRVTPPLSCPNSPISRGPIFGHYEVIDDPEVNQLAIGTYRPPWTPKGL